MWENYKNFERMINTQVTIIIMSGGGEEGHGMEEQRPRPLAISVTLLREIARINMAECQHVIKLGCGIHGWSLYDSLHYCVCLKYFIF